MAVDLEFDPEFEKAWMKHVGRCFSKDPVAKSDYERQKCIAGDAWDWAKEHYAAVPAPTTVSVAVEVLWDAVAALERAEHHVTGKQKSDAATALRLAAHEQEGP